MSGTLQIGGLFEGYGGLTMGVQSVIGGDLSWYSEIEAAPSKILAHHWPAVPNLGDVTKVDWATVPKVDVITGGSPCQDLSHAGKRAGMKAGTRSGLWASMCDAIDIIRPRLVVWENVRGALSASADSAVEPCPLCVGDQPGTTLRALGRVLGDLSELGYDSRWYGLRAADVGAAHGRFRIFLFATPADAAVSGWGSFIPDDVPGRGESDTARRSDDLTLLPTPAAQEPGGTLADYHARLAAHDGRTSSFAPLSMVAQLLPTPRATDGTKGGPNQRGSSGDLMLPTVTASVLRRLAGDADRGPGSPDDANLWIIAQRMWGTDAAAHQVVANEELRDVRNADGTETVREAPRGSGRVPASPQLLPGMRQHPLRGDEGCASLAGEEAQGADVRGVCDDGGSACASQRQEPCEQRPGEPDDALRELSPTTSLAGGPPAAHGSGEESRHNVRQDWREYEAAIRRWEIRFGRPAPDPTELTAKGTHRLSAHFCEWLMGLPEGHVTNVPGISRNDQLKALGNGVVPQQAAAATRVFLHDAAQERAA